MGNFWIVIPARGGSVGIPRKNLKVISGKPLITYSIRTAREVLPKTRVLVITDDEEISTVADKAGATVILENFVTPPEETLDQKIVRNLPELKARGALEDDFIFTLQPTSPLLKSQTLLNAFSKLKNSGSGSVITVVEDKHLRWGISETGHPEKLFADRLNRQYLKSEFRETGGLIGARFKDILHQKTRVIDPVQLLELDSEESIDIDNHSDLIVASHLLSKIKIAIRVDASKVIGMGHIYRMISLASELSRHDVRFYVDKFSPLGPEFLTKLPYKFKVLEEEQDFLDELKSFEPNLIVLDILDTTKSFINSLRSAVQGVKILTFEDGGSGANQTDLVVLEFLSNPSLPHEKVLSGLNYSLLSPGFEITPTPMKKLNKIDNILILFGGTDPSELAQRCVMSLNRIGFEGNVTVVRGLGAAKLPFGTGQFSFDFNVVENTKVMPQIMNNADIAFTSAGRTIIELNSLAIPSICLAQNMKEMSHTHATEENGVHFLGLGSSVSDEKLDSQIQKLLSDLPYLQKLQQNAKESRGSRGNQLVVGKIMNRLGFETISFV